MKGAAAAIITNSKGEYLMQKKDFDYVWYPGMWTLFGGQINEREKAEECLHREIEEELGIKPENVELIKGYHIKDILPIGKIREGTIYIFKVEFSGSLDKIKLGEGAGFAFFSRKELASLNIIPNIRELMLDCFKIEKF